MDISDLRVLRLLEQARDRHRLHRFHDGEIDVRPIRELFARWRERDEQHTYAELARLAGYASTSRVQRLLGELPTSRVVKGEIVYPGRILMTISTETPDGSFELWVTHQRKLQACDIYGFPLLPRRRGGDVQRTFTVCGCEIGGVSLRPA
jgi:hypothetical protein